MRKFVVKVMEGIEDWVQKIVDEIVFFCMRHLGMSRALVAYCAAAIVIVCNGSAFLMTWSTYKFGIVLGYGMLVTQMHMDIGPLAKDVDYGRPKLQILIFLRWLVPFGPVHSMIEMIVEYEMVPTDAETEKELFLNIMDVISDTALVVYVYIHSTPPKPPPRKRSKEQMAKLAALST